MMSFIPNLRGDSQNLQDGLKTESAVLQQILSVLHVLRDTLVFLKNILGQPRILLPNTLGDSKNLREGLTPFAAVLGEPLTQKKKEDWRTADSVVDPSRRFYESPRMISMIRAKTSNSCQKSKEHHNDLKQEAVHIQA